MAMRVKRMRQNGTWKKEVIAAIAEAAANSHHQNESGTPITMRERFDTPRANVTHIQKDAKNRNNVVNRDNNARATQGQRRLK